ncbi:MAG: alginate lyase family protein, partial [Armatimonadetes bacterium]|nr:alginate lyase family protein [Armatimonadota bacterium]
LDHRQKKVWLEEYALLFLDKKPAVVRAADEICSHRFNLLGSGLTDLGPVINWHQDFKSGKVWKGKVIPPSQFIVLKDDSDIKVPWELSRFQHLPLLGKAYWLTGDEKYSEEFVSQVSHWIAENPVGLGVNWACTMDVAIRAANWIAGAYFFRGAKEIPEPFWLDLLKSLLLHGRHIRTHPEAGAVTGNHYLSDLAGLLYLGIMFPEFSESSEWVSFALREMEAQAFSQIYPDGVDFEASVSYHRLVSELFLYSFVLCRENGIPVRPDAMEVVHRMLRFVAAYTKPDGTAPQIGDADDGRFHLFSTWIPPSCAPFPMSQHGWILDHRYLLSTGAVVFDDPSLARDSGTFHEESFWILGPSGRERFAELLEKSSSGTVHEETGSASFPHSGLYVMRQESSYMIIDAGPVGMKGLGGHGHNDVFGFELFAHGVTFLADPGAYVYSADPVSRNLFRSTRYHNVVEVDGEEINRIEPDLLFWMREDTIPKILVWETTTEYDLFAGEHDAYRRLTSPVSCRREILLDRKLGFWILRDRVLGAGRHTIRSFLHPSPLKLSREGGRVRIGDSDSPSLSIIPLEPKNPDLEIIPGFVSYSYGTRREAPYLCYSLSGSVPLEMIFCLFPQEGDPQPPLMKEILGRVDFLRTRFPH